MKKDETRKMVRERYAEVAGERTSCCGGGSLCCNTADRAQDISSKIGYSEEELTSVPDGANLGLGCGNPVAIASLNEGETVLDLGSGPGLDCFLASDKVGRNGRVIGVDMTPEMIDTARANAARGEYTNVEFRLGEIENLPVADNSVDAVISNCVINLSPEKQKVFSEMFRVLKPGGRIMISDIVLSKELPQCIKGSLDAYVGCIAGAITKDEYVAALSGAGFSEVSIINETPVPVDEWIHDPAAEAAVKKLNVSLDQARDILGSVISVQVKGVK
jgi:SAM-dependent methyltransferase